MAQDRDRVDRFLPLKPFVLDVLLELADGKRHGWSLIRDIQQRDGGDRILPTNFYRTLAGASRRRADRRGERRCQRRSRRAPSILQPDLARREGRARGGEAPRSAGRRSAGAEVVEGPPSRGRFGGLDTLTMPTSRSLYRLLLRLCPADLRAQFGNEMEAPFCSRSAAHAASGRRGCGRGRSRMSFATASARGGTAGGRSGRLRRTSSTESGGWWMDTLRYDLRHAIRAMSRQPATSLIIVLTLALAIGANTAVFSAVHTVLIRPLPYEQPDSLVMLWEKREAEGVMKNSVSPADYIDWARIATSFTAMAAMTEVTVDLTGEGDPEKVTVAAVSAPFFEVFGVRPLHGRTFEAGEDTIGRHRVRHPRPRVLAAALRRRSGRRRPLDHAQRQCPSRSSACCRRMSRSRHRSTDAFVPLVTQATPDAAVAHLASVQRLRAAEAGRVVRAGASGNGSHRQGSRDSSIRN